MGDKDVSAVVQEPSLRLGFLGAQLADLRYVAAWLSMIIDCCCVVKGRAMAMTDADAGRR
jgi:hypothetical protein